MINNNNNGKVVITYGTFDLFHVGHLRLLQRLSLLGEKLIVGVSTDDFNLKKGKSSVIPYAHRAEIVGSLACVDSIFEEEDWGQKADDIIKYDVDIFAMGNDWVGKFDGLKQYCDVRYLERTENISSTDLKKKLQEEFDIKPEDMKRQFDILRLILSEFI